MLRSSRTEREMALQNVRNNKDMRLVLSSDAKPRLKWTQGLHERFVDAVNQLGGANKATPKSLMRAMGVSGLTLYHLKSHLQKYRMVKNKHSQSYYEDSKQENNRSRKNCDGEQNQINESMQIAQALQVQMEVQREIHEQIEVQRHLQLRIEAHGKYLQSVLKKAQETLAAGYSASSTEVERAKARLSQLVTMVDTGCLSPSASVLTESESLLLKDAKHIPRHTRCSLESSLTSAESSGREEQTRPMLDLDHNGKRNHVVLSLMEMHPAENSGLESQVSDMKRNRNSTYDGKAIVQQSGKRSEGDTSHEQLLKFGLLDTFDLNSKCPTEFDSGPKAIDLNCNAVEQFTGNL